MSQPIMACPTQMYPHVRGVVIHCLNQIIGTSNSLRILPPPYAPTRKHNGYPWDQTVDGPPHNFTQNQDTHEHPGQWAYRCGRQTSGHKRWQATTDTNDTGRRRGDSPAPNALSYVHIKAAGTHLGCIHWHRPRQHPSTLVDDHGSGPHANARF